ncbi:MAG: hypothetical protein HY822_14465 [Acidobacteria bacterium]|nr:hypothetical protein [Acidobacteriota bacterium]
MRIKSYFSNSVKDAMRAAREELGSDAMLLNSRAAPPEAAHLGRCEVVFGLGEKPGGKAEAPGAERDLAAEFEALRRQIERLRGDVADQSAPPAPACTPRTDAHLGASRRSPVAALVGPSGTGKTTCIAKLALREARSAGRAVRLVSLGIGRVGHTDHLRSYARIAGLEFQALPNPCALRALVGSRRPGTLTLIDTPGFAQTDRAEAERIAAALVSEPEIDVHLVLSAGARPEDLPRFLAFFAPFRPAKLLFTRLDETLGRDTILQAAETTGLPLSYFSAGPRVPEDLAPAELSRLPNAAPSQEREALIFAA